MGRGRPFAGHKIVPPKGARWAPKANGRAKCMAVQIKQNGKKFMEASNICKRVLGPTYSGSAS